MKTDKNIQKLAVDIVNKSKVEGRVDETILNKFTSVLKKSDEPIALQILAEIEKVLVILEKQSTILVESAFELTSVQLDSIKNYFEREKGRKLGLEFTVNKDLLSGIKIQLGDFVWENSIVSKLNDLKGKLSYE